MAEGFRNVISYGAITVFVMIIVLAVSTGVLLATVLETRSIVDRAENLRILGAEVFDVSPSDAGAGLSAIQCESVNGMIGTQAAGAIIERTTARSSFDQADWSSLQITPGFAELAWPTKPPSEGYDLLIGSKVADWYGLSDGTSWSYLSRSGPVTSTVQVMPPSARMPDMDRTVASVRPPLGSISSCLVEAVPGYTGSLISVAGSWFGSADVKVTPYPVGAGDYAPQQQLNERVSVWLVVAAASVVLIICAGYWKIRERDFGLYSLQGMPSTRMLSMLSTEALLLTGMPTILSILVTAVSAREALDSVPVLGAFLFASGCMAVYVLLLPVCGFLLLPARSALSRLRS